MSKSSFAKTIINKLAASIGTDGGSYTSSSASTAMSAVAAGITEYLLANTTVSIAYAGMIPSVPPVPDPVVTDSFKIIGTCAPTKISNSFDDWIRQIETNIIKGFSLAPAGTLGVVFAQKPFLNPGIKVTQAQLKSIHDISDKSPQQKVWEVICESIMEWLNTTAMNATSAPASRPTGPSTGVANIVKITIA